MWLLLPVLTPMMVIAAALALQRLERIALTPNPAVPAASGPTHREGLMVSAPSTRAATASPVGPTSTEAAARLGP